MKSTPSHAPRSMRSPTSELPITFLPCSRAPGFPPRVMKMKAAYTIASTTTRIAIPTAVFMTFCSTLRTHPQLGAEGEVCPVSDPSAAITGTLLHLHSSGMIGSNIEPFPCANALSGERSTTKRKRRAGRRRRIYTLIVRHAEVRNYAKVGTNGAYSLTVECFSPKEAVEVRFLVGPQTTKETFSGPFCLLLNLLKNLSLPGARVELLKFKLPFHLLLVLAREDNVPRGALQLY